MSMLYLYDIFVYRKYVLLHRSKIDLKIHLLILDGYRSSTGMFFIGDKIPSGIIVFC